MKNIKFLKSVGYTKHLGEHIVRRLHCLTKKIQSSISWMEFIKNKKKVNRRLSAFNGVKQGDLLVQRINKKGESMLKLVKILRDCSHMSDLVLFCGPMHVCL